MEEHGEGNISHGGPGCVSLQGREGQVGVTLTRAHQDLLATILCSTLL